MVEIDFNPYGFSKTKRETSFEAEEILFKSYKMYKQKAVRISEGNSEFVDNPSQIRLIDYIGGDDTMLLAATGGFGLDITQFKSQIDFFRFLRQNKIREPFKFTELKFHIECPIKPALIIVPYSEANVNEYSGRYSVMSDVFHLPDIKDKMKLKKIVDTYALAAKSYEGFLEKDFTKELSRNVLGLGNFTQFYWKLNLESLFDFISENESKHLEMQPYVNAFKKIAKCVAPIAYVSFESVDNNSDFSDLEAILDFYKIQKSRKPLDNPHGISETKRLCIKKAENELFNPKKCLEQGYLSLIDYMGGDESIVQAARVSYGRGTKKVSQDNELIRYLYRHGHTTPFEMIELSFEAKLPFFVERQWVRHRTADKTGIAGLFLPCKDFYFPEESQIRKQSKSNKQGRAEEMCENDKLEILDTFYTNYLEQSMKEILVKGVGHFMHWTWKCDLKNILNFLNLRLDEHAQHEVREYAKEMAGIVKEVSPFSWKAFNDYTLHSINFSKAETEILNEMLSGKSFNKDIMEKAGIHNKFEQGEVEKKFGNLRFWE
ncbi:MAG: FAD-dependent thymidylate synthase [Nanoarchaeota archaeon]|nr:FAD-dependent thymidylate synthase [Nanoarchaeota archaeon]